MMAKIEPFERHAPEYDAWYDRNRLAYESEIDALRSLMPESSRRVEVGVGTGRFASRLGVKHGVDPSNAMAAIARRRGIDVVQGVAESLPFGESALDLVLMVTTVCFLDDVAAAFGEAYRTLAPGGHVLVGFLDRQSKLGKLYDERKAASPFYSEATFRSAEEVLSCLNRAGFRDLLSVQTLFEEPGSTAGRALPKKGHGEGLFVAVRGRKRASRLTLPGHVLPSV